MIGLRRNEKVPSHTYSCAVVKTVKTLEMFPHNYKQVAKAMKFPSVVVSYERREAKYPTMSQERFTYCPCLHHHSILLYYCFSYYREERDYTRLLYGSHMNKLNTRILRPPTRLVSKNEKRNEMPDTISKTRY
jgi:hypothetical protein